MIIVSSQTSKKELLSQLQETSQDSLTLFIQLNSLPSFLNTPVAFTIFNYQINSYPRQITWVAGTSGIFEVLKAVKTSIISADQYHSLTGKTIEIESTPSTKSKPEELYEGSTVNNKVTAQSSEKQKSNGVKLSGLSALNPAPKLNESKAQLTNTVINDSGNSFVDKNKPLIATITNTSTPYTHVDFKSVPKSTPTLTTDVESKSKAKYETLVLHEILNSEGAFVQSGQPVEAPQPNQFFNQNNFKSSPLLEPFDSSSDESSSFGSNAAGQAKQQNLDIWLERLSATKVALDSLKYQAQSDDNDNTGSQGTRSTFSNNTTLLRVDQNPNPSRVANGAPVKRFNNIFFVTGSMAMAAFAVAFIILFPTIAYTVTVKPEQLEENTEIQMSIEDFAKRSAKLTSSSKTPSSGQLEVPTERSIGQVSLINPGNRDVTLDNGKFRLIANNLEYEAVLNSTLSNTFRIPARNNLNGPAIEFTMQAREPGPEYNLPEGSQLEIVNLLGQKVCLNCFGITISNVQNSQISGEKTVTDADHSLLLGTSESDLAKKRVEEIAKIQEDDIFTNPEWFKNTGSSYDFTQLVGTQVPEVALNVEVNTDIYYLPREVLENKIKEANQDVDTINQLALIETNGSFTEDQSIALKIFYSYDKTSDISTQEVRSQIKDADCHSSPADLQVQYPNIDYVDCRNLGVPIPGINPRVDVTIVKD